MSPNRRREKKAFLRRGSSNKYTPNPTTLKKQNDTAKKYSYYADNFSEKNPEESNTEVIEDNKKEPPSPELKTITTKVAKKSA